MHIVHIASEFASYAKVGGLADVSFGLSRALVQQDQQVSVILPKYPHGDLSQLKNLERLELPVHTTYKDTLHTNTIWKANLKKITIFLIEPTTTSFFKSNEIYPKEQQLEQFLYFSKACVDFIHSWEKSPDLLHVHDWPTAIIPAIEKEIPTLLTIHNLAHQGTCPPELFEDIGLPGREMLSFDNAQDPNIWDCCNLLKTGIVHADHITTVSPSYAKEVLTSLGGQSLDKTLSFHGDKFSGILNGIDTDYWSTRKNKHLFKEYGVRSLKGKQQNKEDLQKLLNLECRNTFLVCAISRLTEQKSPYLIYDSLLHTLEKGGQFILMGKCSDEETERFFNKLAAQYANHSNVSILLEQDENLAHKTFAASDLIIIPSLFEPCGLTQMIAFHYGTIPLVRKTGGLKDTVCNFNETPSPEQQSRGFTFSEPSKKELLSSLDDAIETYNNPKLWKQLVTQGMKVDFSWKSSSNCYLDLYKKVALKKKQLLCG
jgi:starch synthase